MHVEHPFALHVETLTRRRQQLDLRRALDDLPQQVRALDEVLEVVEHEQRRPLAEVVEELFLRREATARAVRSELNRLRNRRRQELRRHHRDERDEVDAVRVALDPACGRLEREPGLTRSARADEREQAAVGILEQPVDLVQLRRAPDERRAWSRQVLHPRLDRLQQREVAWKPFDLELVDALGGAEILEAVHAQVADVRIHERPGRLRHEHLPAVADGRDPCALVHVEADVSLFGQLWLARVQPHPYAYRPVGKCALAVRGGSGGVRRSGERNEERVALRVDLDAVVVGEHRAESPPMLVQRLSVVVSQLVQQPRRALHVREQQRHDTGREIAHHRARSWSGAAPLSSAPPPVPRGPSPFLRIRRPRDRSAGGGGVFRTMRHAATHIDPHERGDARLLHHLGTLDRMLGDDRLPARVRLEDELGLDLARVLTGTTRLPAPSGRGLTRTG